MKKFYSSLIALACAAFGVNAAAQVSQVVINTDYTTSKVAAKSLDQITFSREDLDEMTVAPVSRAGHYCEQASYAFDNMFARLDYFDITVDKETDGDKTIYYVNGFLQLDKLRIEVDEDNNVVIPLQKVAVIDNYFGEGDALEAYVGDAATVIAASPKVFPASAVPVMQKCAKFDDKTGEVRVPVMYVFWADDLENQQTGEVIASWYPVCRTVREVGSDYNFIRLENLQLGDYDKEVMVEYSDPYLPALGFTPISYEVKAQRNTLFPATIRLTDVYGSNPDLQKDDFQLVNGGRALTIRYVYNIDDNTNFLGKNYAEMNILGVAYQNFRTENYVHFMMADQGSTYKDIKALPGVINGNNVLYDKNPLGTVKDGILTFGNFCNLMYGLTYNDQIKQWLMPSAATFVETDMFSLDLRKLPLGVESIIADDTNDAPVEYYNIQGVRVDNPVKGGLYIRRQGAEASKVIL